MVFKLYRCLKSESCHFHEIGHLFDMESEYYHYLKFSNCDEEIFSREEVQAINCIDTTSNQYWNKVTEEQIEFINEMEKSYD